MNRTFLIFEKIIAAILVLYGCISLYSTIIMVRTLTSFALELNHEKGDFLPLRISIGYYFLILVSSLAIPGGVLLFLSKKIGWVVSLITSLLFGLELFIAIIESYSLNNENAFLISARIFMAALFFGITFCLLLQPFRIKYNMVLKN